MVKKNAIRQKQFKQRLGELLMFKSVQPCVHFLIKNKTRMWLTAPGFKRAKGAGL